MDTEQVVSRYEQAGFAFRQSDNPEMLSFVKEGVAVIIKLKSHLFLHTTAERGKIVYSVISGEFNINTPMSKILKLCEEFKETKKRIETK
jgi:hypothetical protein